VVTVVAVTATVIIALADSTISSIDPWFEVTTLRLFHRILLGLLHSPSWFVIMAHVLVVAIAVSVV
jgi:hypothetical protein